ncbi:hypothetical protein [Streptomyces sp. NRRL B-24484]|uniref:hypothetical protein n=1 Tax=Streptomyces sp. NRRL B-24484 TaxID=1463833 RepID=UPI0006931E12|nr:hypothetical protein [Streptomyces sp. NRRL B-24484]
MLSKRSVAASVLCALLATGATACNGDKNGPAAAPAPAKPSASPVPTLAVDTLTADQISDRAHAAMAALASVKVDGELTMDGGKLAVHLTSDKQGNCSGTVASPEIGQFELRHSGTKTWLKADETTWKKAVAKEPGATAQDAAIAAELFKGRFITGGDSRAELAEAAMMCNLIKGLFADDSDKGKEKIAKGGAGTTNGVKTFGLTVTTEDGETVTLHIATEGKPYLVRMEQLQGKEPAAFDFSEFDKPFTVQEPPADQVVDFSVFEKKVKKA